ncbi:hypothetical protein SISNIDRAFT_469436 [Sistotremastrum niveocremeum HHB9708]|uniref:Uncharacterized protein n=1 Tax=Sistotremastrum niveocremeum HHB9708 TaxID=1314777 RepID=A0A164Q840_9AGAM|nr:hypothetical protein SISNIDRAFT_469436 [Sistotremastrum niveocremeum HHB9708]
MERANHHSVTTKFFTYRRGDSSFRLLPKVNPQPSSLPQSLCDPKSPKTFSNADTQRTIKRRHASLGPDAPSAKKARFSLSDCARFVTLHLITPDRAIQLAHSFKGVVTYEGDDIQIELSSQSLDNLVRAINNAEQQNRLIPLASCTQSAQTPPGSIKQSSLGAYRVGEVIEPESSVALRLSHPPMGLSASPSRAFDRSPPSHRIRQFQGIVYHLWQETAPAVTADLNDLNAKTLDQVTPQHVLRPSNNDAPQPGDIYQLLHTTSTGSIIWVRNLESWSRVEEGHPHPIQVQYVLSVRKDGQPSWVKKETWRKYGRLLAPYRSSIECMPGSPNRLKLTGL